MATIDEKIKKAREAGYSDEEIAKFLGTKTTGLTGGKKTINKVSELLNSIGLGAIPGAAATLYEAPGGVSRAVQGKEMARPVEEAQQDNPFLTGQKARSLEAARTEGPMANLEQTGREAAGLAAWQIPTGAGAGNLLSQVGRMALQGAGRLAAGKASQEGTNVGDIAKAGVTGAVVEPSIGILLKAIPALLKRSNPGGVGKLTAEKVASATGRSEPITYNEVANLARKDALEKYGFQGQIPKKTRDALNKVIAEYEPALVGESTGKLAPKTLNESHLLGLRKAIPATYGYGDVTPDAERKAAELLRMAASKTLKKMVPEIKNLDKLATFYAKAPKYLKYGAGGAALFALLKGALGQRGSEAVTGAIAP